MQRYLEFSPRGFANEQTIRSVVRADLGDDDLGRRPASPT